MNLKTLFCLAIYLFTWLSGSAQNNDYSNPVKIPLLLSGSFAELRSNHFHSGMDIKTNGITGLPVYAVADGFISRISVSPGGFGLALYIEHANGTTSVYGHLDSFRNDIEQFVKNTQYNNESFRVNLLLSPEEFPVKKADFIGKSGNSGSSGGPHLHFELRDTKNEHPVNPLKYGFNVADTKAPKIFSVMLVPLSNISHVDYKQESQIYQVEQNSGQYQITENRVIPVYGETGFAIQTNDYFDGSLNKCGVYSLQLKIDGEPYFAYQHDRFSFDETRYINSHIVYEEYIKNGNRFQKTWLDPGNKLNIYNITRENGMYNFNDGNIHHIHIELKDFHGNSSSIVFNVESKFNPGIKQDDTYLPLFRFSEKNKHERKDIELEIPEGALYTNINFRYKNLPATNNFFSSIHVLHTNLTPLHKPVSLKIRAEKIPKKLEKKLLVVQVDTLDFTYRAAGVGTYKNGWIETNIQNFGNYAVAADTIPPLIIPLSIKNKETITETNRLRFKISDNLSGINKIEGRIDGKWALFEYDAKNNLITHYFDDERFELKKRHTFVLKITDYQNNSSVYEASFWK